MIDIKKFNYLYFIANQQMKIFFFQEPDNPTVSEQENS